MRLRDTFVYLLNVRVIAAVATLRTGEQKEMPGETPIVLWSTGGTGYFRNIEIREINALPPEIVELAAWQPLFNGEDLSGWSRSNATDTGLAEVVVEDGGPVLRLTPPIALHGPKLGNRHLRYEIKSSGVPGGGINHFVPGCYFSFNRLPCPRRSVMRHARSCCLVTRLR